MGKVCVICSVKATDKDLVTVYNGEHSDTLVYACKKHKELPKRELLEALKKRNKYI